MFVAQLPEIAGLTVTNVGDVSVPVTSVPGLRKTQVATVRPDKIASTIPSITSGECAHFISSFNRYTIDWNIHYRLSYLSLCLEWNTYLSTLILAYSFQCQKRSLHNPNLKVSNQFRVHRHPEYLIHSDADQLKHLRHCKPVNIETLYFCAAVNSTVINSTECRVVYLKSISCVHQHDPDCLIWDAQHDWNESFMIIMLLHWMFCASQWFGVAVSWIKYTIL